MSVNTSYNGFSAKIRSESWDWMKKEEKAGRLGPPLGCQVCGETGGHLDYHTEDYSKPFGPHIYEFQLCFRCHMMLHIRFRRQRAWKRYIEQLEAGAVYQPLMHRGEINKINSDAWIDQPEMFGPPRERLEWFRSLTLSRAEDRDPSQAELFPA